MMGGVSVVALILLGHVRAELSGRPPGRGLFGRGADVAVGMGMHTVFGGGGSTALSGAMGLRGRFPRGQAPTPWEQVDRAARDAAKVHGSPQPGVDPVPNAPGDVPASGQDRDSPGETGMGPAGVAWILEEVDRVSGGGHGARRGPRRQSAGAPDPAGSPDDPGGNAADVAPITEPVETMAEPLSPQPPQEPTTVDPVDDTP
jgi:hypothetical protein